jgi:hypothetical protein
MTDKLTNEQIERLTARLSPEGRAVIEDLTALSAALAETESVESMTPETAELVVRASDRADALTDEDRDLVSRIWHLHELDEGGPVPRVARDLVALHGTDRTLRNVLNFINDDSNLTPEGIAARDALLVDLEAIQREHEPE